MIRIGLIRHGMTDWNKEKRAQGSSDIPLNCEGEQGAEQLAERLQSESWNVLYTSDLTRAKQTAEIIRAKQANIPIYVDARLREVGGGLIEGTTEQERIAKWGMNWDQHDLGREQNDQVWTRAQAILGEIVQAHEGQNVLIVSHGSFVRQLLQMVFPVAERRESLANCSLTIIEKAQQWELKTHNDRSHLKKSLHG